jgi:hypothetical protein
MKPTLPQDDGGVVSNEGWKVWNEYMHSLINAQELVVVGKAGKSAKTKTLVGILNFIMDVGYQPQQDGQYDTKCALPSGDEKYSADELVHLDKYPTNDFVWVDDNGVRKRKQTSPKRPEQEYVFFFDFPEVIVDYTKHPDEKMHVLGQRPLRISYNGRYGKVNSLVFNRTLPLTVDHKTKTLSPKNPINKIADKMGVVVEFTESGYDLGVLAGKACKWSVSSEKRVHEGDTYYAFTIKDPSKIEEVSAGGFTITVEQQIPKCEVPFVGIHFNGVEYDMDAIDYIKNRKEVIEVVQRAVSFKPSPVKFPDFVIGCDFKNSGLAKALGLTVVDSTQAPEDDMSIQPDEDDVFEPIQTQSPTSDNYDEDIPF